MIRISNLCKTFFPGRVNEINALQGINLNFKPADFVVIVGANGSGKSTLLNTISGSIIPDSGTVEIDGSDVANLPEHRRSKWVARVFQDPLSGTASGLSILENFRLASLRTKTKAVKIGINKDFERQVKEKIAQLGMNLENKINQPMGSLSGGQRQALTLMMAVMDEARILLLDEPTAALDPRSAEIVMQTADKIIRDYKLTAMLVTHNMKEAFDYGNRIIHMSEGLIAHDLSGPEKRNLKPVGLYEWFM